MSCWNYSFDIITLEDGTHICPRCQEVIGNKDEKSWIEFVSDDYITAINKLKNLEMYRESSEPNYTFFIQDENENIKCCNGNIEV